jgi:hypothetical protein
MSGAVRKILVGASGTIYAKQMAYGPNQEVHLHQDGCGQRQQGRPECLESVIGYFMHPDLHGKILAPLDRW